jgi:hypothetical protein
MRRTANIALILILIIALGMICVQPVKAQYQGNITINADGSISPSSAPIQFRGNTYTLTNNIDGGISVDRNNSVVDGNGLTITNGIQIGYNNAPPSPPAPSLVYTSNVTVENFVVEGSSAETVFGIQLIETSKVVIINNTITGTGNGPLSLDEPTAAIDVEGGSSNVIFNNSIVSNYNGINFFETNSNLVVENTIENSLGLYGGGCGIILWGSSYNIVYHNNFVNNVEQAYEGTFNSASLGNVWDDGYPGGGNYWSDYSKQNPKATEINGTGIGDEPYVIDPHNEDRYPLLELFNQFHVIATTPPIISVQSPIHRMYNGSTVALVFTVDKSVEWIRYSIDGKRNVTINGNTTLTGLSGGSHNIRVYANDTFGNVGASQTVNFTIPQPFPTLVVIAVISVAVAISVILLIYRRHLKTSNEKATLTV